MSEQNLPQPQARTLLKMLKRKEQISQEWKKLDEAIEKMVKKYGEAVFYGQIDDELKQLLGIEDDYFRMEFVDTIAKLQRGESVVAPSVIKLYNMSCRYLKRRPKELE